MTRVAVVTIAHGRHEHLAAQHRSLARGTVRPDHYLVVAMDDPAIVEEQVDGLTREVVAVGRGPAGGLPLAAARNLGVRTAIDAGADVVVLLDVDCLAGAGLVASYADVVAARPERIWSGPVTYLPPRPPGGYPDDPADLADWDDPHPARPNPAPGELLESDDPDLFWSLSFAVAPAHVGAPRRLLRGLHRLRRRGHRPGSYGDRPRHRRSAGSAAPAPTTSTTRSAALRSSTSTTSCATAGSSTSGGASGR